MTTFRRPQRKFAKKAVHSKIDKNSYEVLEMLGFNIPALIEELLANVSGQRRCPCCGREVRPVIVGRKLDLNAGLKE